MKRKANPHTNATDDESDDADAETATQNDSHRAEDQGVGILFAKIVSGGQTGVDRAGLDWAIRNRIEHGGWCPKGRLAEDGRIDSSYQLREMNSRSYPARTRRNVEDSDATLLLYRNKMGSGTALTLKLAKELSRPHFVFKLGRDDIQSAAQWWWDHQPKVLNLAGPRESSDPGIYLASLRWLDDWSAAIVQQRSEAD